MRRGLAFVVAASMALAACGGGGANGGVPVVSGATPTPSPTGTPTPTPGPTYSTYAQLAGDQSFKTGCGALRFDASPAQSLPVTPFGGGLTLGYAAATQTYTVSSDPITSGGFGSAPRSYGPADRDATVTASTSYARTTNGFQERLSIGSNTAAGASPDYVRGFSLRVPLSGYAGANPPAIQYQCIFGVPTRLDDEPRGVGSVTFTRTGLNGTAIVYPASGAAPDSYSIARSQVSFSVDLATYRVTTTLRVIGNQVTAAGTSTTDVDLGTYSGAVTIDEAGFYNGLLTSSDRSVQFASFGGWFFGPQGVEAAYAAGIMSLDTSTGRRLSLIGNALALR